MVITFIENVYWTHRQIVIITFTIIYFQIEEKSSVDIDFEINSSRIFVLIFPFPKNILRLVRVFIVSGWTGSSKNKSLLFSIEVNLTQTVSTVLYLIKLFYS